MNKSQNKIDFILAIIVSVSLLFTAIYAGKQFDKQLEIEHQQNIEWYKEWERYDANPN